jgi:hypothetical protein
MFRARFDEAFPKSLPHYGPQDIERGAVDNPPGDYIERLLCALLGLVLNRKKDVEYGRHPMPNPARHPSTHALWIAACQLIVAAIANSISR